MKEVVGTIFLQKGKVLIVKPAEKNEFKIVGGKVGEGETPLQTAVRKVKEELGPNIIIDETRFKEVMDFEEECRCSKDKVHVHIFRYEGAFRGKIEIPEELDGFVWYNTESEMGIFANPVLKNVLAYLVRNNLID